MWCLATYILCVQYNMFNLSFGLIHASLIYIIDHDIFVSLDSDCVWWSAEGVGEGQCYLSVSGA